MQEIVANGRLFVDVLQVPALLSHKCTRFMSLRAAIIIHLIRSTSKGLFLLGKDDFDYLTLIFYSH